MPLCDDVFSTTDYCSGAPREANPLLLILRRSQLALTEKAGLEPDTFASLQLYRHMTSSDLLGCMHPQKYININLYSGPDPAQFWAFSHVLDSEGKRTQSVFLHG